MYLGIFLSLYVYFSPHYYLVCVFCHYYVVLFFFSLLGHHPVASGSQHQKLPEIEDTIEVTDIPLEELKSAEKKAAPVMISKEEEERRRRMPRLMYHVDSSDGLKLASTTPEGKLSFLYVTCLFV